MRKKAAAKYLQQLAEQHQLQIDTKEEQRHFLLALDKQNKKLLYIKQPAENPQSTLIDLKEVQSCRVADIAQTFYMDDDKKRKDVLTTQISLELIYPKREEAFAITFYDYIEHSSDLLQELRAKANHWNNQVNDAIGDVKA